MFRGIFIFQRDYAETLIRNKAFGTISASQREEIISSAKSSQAVSASEAIISQLRKIDKNIFSSLHYSIYTGNPYKVFHQLNKTIDKIFDTEYIQKRLRKDSDNNKPNTLNTGSAEPTCWVAAVVAAGIAIVVAAVAVVNAVAELTGHWERMLPQQPT